jgi:Leucine-rich repeat (LRR) protein
MPSLEILDISRNKIKRLPSQPGSLANLRVRFDPHLNLVRFMESFSGILHVKK